MKKNRFAVKKILTVLIVLAMTLSMELTVFAGEGTPTEGQDYDDVIAIVHINDVHGYCDVEPYVKAVADSLKEEYGDDHVLIFHAGDATRGAMFATLSDGEYPIQLMNMVGYDAMAVGNHEMALDLAQAQHLAEEANFPFLAANVTDLNGNLLFDPSTEFEIGDVKIGVFGDTPGIIGEDGEPVLDDRLFIDAIEASEQAIEGLRADGCQIIIGLTHLGFDLTNTSYDPTSNLLADSIQGIDLIIDGHSHSVVAGEDAYVSEATGTTVVQTGEYGNNIGVVYLYLKDGAVADVVSTLISKEEYMEAYTPDPEIQALYDELNAKIDEDISVVVGHIDVDLIYEKELVRAGETNLCNFLTDAFLYHFQDEADIVFIPGTRIRAGINAGDVTLKDLMTAMGNASELFKMTLTGSEIRELLNKIIANLPEQSYEYNQVAGLTYTYVLSEDGNYVVDIVLADGTPIDEAAEYTVLMDTYTDLMGYDFTGLTPVTQELSDTVAILQEYLQSEDCMVYPEAQNRAQQVEAE